MSGGNKSGNFRLTIKAGDEILPRMNSYDMGK
jgi:hypothetical protein